VAHSTVTDAMREEAADAAPTPTVERTGPSRQALVIRAEVVIALGLLIYAPILYHLVQHWRHVADYSHGFLIVPLALYFAWERRDKLARVAIEPSWWGLVPLTLGLLSLTIGRLGVELMAMRVGFVLTLIGLVGLLLGLRVLRLLLFPLLFLFLMIPLPQSLVNTVAFPLQLVAAQLAVEIMHWLGVPVLLEGNIIHLPHTSLFVAEACSGLRSLMALITLGVVFAYFFRRHWAERLIIVASAIPIAILVNAIRVALTGILTARFGNEAAGGFVHDFQGVITFSVAFVLLLAEARLLARFGPARWRSARTRRPVE